MKTQSAELTGKVTLILPNANFRVKVEGIEKEILCYLSGKMAKNYIKPEIGDSVKIEVHPSDLSKGRITRRF